MSRKTLFEIDEGREALKLKKYCEDMPVWKSMIHSALAGFLLYLLILVLVCVAHYEWVEQVVKSLGTVWVVVILAISMAIVVAAYTLVSDFVFRRQYKKEKSRLCRYRTSLMRLDKIRREQLLMMSNEENLY